MDVGKIIVRLLMEKKIKVHTLFQLTYNTSMEKILKALSFNCLSTDIYRMFFQFSFLYLIVCNFGHMYQINSF